MKGLMEGAWSHFFLGNFSPKEIYIENLKEAHDKLK